MISTISIVVEHMFSLRRIDILGRRANDFTCDLRPVCGLLSLPRPILRSYWSRELAFVNIWYTVFIFCKLDMASLDVSLPG